MPRNTPAPAAPQPDLPMPTTGGSFMRESDGSLTMIDGAIPPTGKEISAETTPSADASTAQEG